MHQIWEIMQNLQQTRLVKFVWDIGFSTPHDINNYSLKFLKLQSILSSGKFLKSCMFIHIDE